MGNYGAIGWRFARAIAEVEGRGNSVSSDDEILGTVRIAGQISAVDKFATQESMIVKCMQRFQHRVNLNLPISAFGLEVGCKPI